MEETRREVPFVVFIAAMFGFAKAAFLGFMGFIGIIDPESTQLANDAVSDPWGGGALVLAAVFALASFALLRGSRVARLVLAAFAVVSGLLALLYVFIGPTSAIFPSLVAATLAALLIWLLYGARGAKEYFA